MEDKYIVFRLEGEDFVQYSIPLDTVERAEEFTNASNPEYHYLITKVIKYT